MLKQFSAVLPLLFFVLIDCPSFGQDRPSNSNRDGSNQDRSRPVNSVPAFRLSSQEQRMVNAVNKYRANHGLKPLKVDPVLMCEARQAAPYFSHTINGKWCWHRCRQRGFRGWATDDIANGYPNPEDAVRGWATSDGHARQMRGYFKMNGRWQNYNFDRIGVGISGRKYIAIFGRQGIRS
jgi:uncharacterized protein YkwD